MPTMDQITNEIYRQQDLQREGPSRDRCNYSRDRGFYSGGPCMDSDEPCLCFSAEALRARTDHWAYMCRRTKRRSGYETEFEERVFKKRGALKQRVADNEEQIRAKAIKDKRRAALARQDEHSQRVTASLKSLRTIADWIEPGTQARKSTLST